MINIEKKYHFYAAHRNLQAGEKCARIHGHAYDVTLNFAFEPPAKNTGICMLFSDIDKVAEPFIKSHCHWLLLHSEDTLCKVLRSAGEAFIELPFPTSAENLARYFYENMQQHSLPIKSVTIQETKSSIVTYEPNTRT